MMTLSNRFSANFASPACAGLLLTLLHFPQSVLALECSQYEYAKADQLSSGDLPAAPSFLLEVTHPRIPSSYVFGTFHSADPAVLAKWHTIPLLMAVSPPRVVVTERLFEGDELPDEDPRLLPENQNLRQVLKGDSQLYDGIIQALKGYNLPHSRTDEFRPWFASALILQGPAMRYGENGANLDEYIYQQAKKMDRQIVGLESLKELAAYYEKYFSSAEQVELLSEAVCNQRLNEQNIQRQTDAYAKDDVAKMYQVMGEHKPPNPVLGNKLYEIFVKQRNRIFWERLRKEFRRGGAFVVVGSLHVFGKDGIWDKLKGQGAKDGFAIRKVDLEGMRFDIDIEEVKFVIDWILKWSKSNVEVNASRGVFDGLQIKHKSVPALRRMLCQRKRCKVEGTYAESEKSIYLATGIFARIMLSKVTPDYYLQDAQIKKKKHVSSESRSADSVYADSILVRELTRHVLYETLREDLKVKYEDAKGEGKTSDRRKFVEGCIRNRILHLASLAQHEYVRARNNTERIHVFTINPLCGTETASNQRAAVSNAYYR